MGQASTAKLDPDSKRGLFQTHAGLLPGIGLAVAVAVGATFARNWFSVVISPVLFAVVAGLLIRNILSLPASVQAGLKFAANRLLRLGIMLLGIRLSFVDVVQIGAVSLGIILISMVAALLLVTYVGRWARLTPTLATLIAVGTAVCGNSAIAAAAPVIRAKDEDISFAVATITLFGTLALFAFPFFGKVLDLAPPLFGLWAGVAVNDTSQVIAAGFAYSGEAGEVATVVKLTRNVLMAPLILVLGSLYGRRTGESGAHGVGWHSIIPWFVMGFLLLAAINSAGILPGQLAGVLGRASEWLLLTALAGIGLNTRMAEMRKTGVRPFYVGLLASLFMALFTLALITLLWDVLAPRFGA